MALPENINTLEKAKFIDYNGDVCLRVVVMNPIAGGDSIKNHGVENIINGLDYVTIVFDTAMLNTGYCPLISFESIDDDPIFLNYVIKEKTTTGMTVKLNAPVNSNNYFMSWAVLEVTP